jgi:hypothetical protein
MFVLYRPDTGHEIPLVGRATPSDLARHPRYYEAEVLYECATGNRLVVTRAQTVEAGRAPDRLIAAQRSDAGHEGERAYIRAEEWERMPEAARKALLVEEKPLSEQVRRVAESLSHGELAAMIAAQREEIEALRRANAPKADGSKGAR